MSLGTLYIVATPIGHLGDITYRAVEILKGVSLIAAEDTRRSSILLNHYAIETPMISYHEHNEQDKSEQILDKLQSGKSIALISDAGTPLISDPGYVLVRLARSQNIPVVPLPGPCAAVTALSASGLPTDSFLYVGFLPARSSQRKKRLEALTQESATLVLYEAKHRIVKLLKDCADVFGHTRLAVIARELTKSYETFLEGSFDELTEQLMADEAQCKGEFVVMIKGLSAVQDEEPDPEVDHILVKLLEELPVKQAVMLAVKITGFSKNRVYQRALDLTKA